MTAETIPDGDNIPPVGISVNEIYASALVGLSVRVRDLGLSVSADISPDDQLEVISRIFDVENKSSLRAKFYLGDACRSTMAWSVARKTFLARVRTRFGESGLRAVRQYAWVARKWPEDRRTDRKSWTWYERNKPGVPSDAKVERRRTELVLVSEQDGMLVLATASGIEFTYRQAVQEAIGAQPE